jgi:hypothetical protein
LQLLSFQDEKNQNFQFFDFQSDKSDGNRTV